MLPKAKLAWFVFLTLLLLVVFKFAGFFRPIQNALHLIFSPIGVFFNTAGTAMRKNTEGKMDADECLDKYTDLDKRLASVSVDYVRLRALEEENAYLRKTLGYLQKQSFDSVTASVISRSAVPEIATVMIDRGLRDGLEIGMPAIVGDGIFIGKITSIRERTSIVTLVSDPASRVAVAKAGQHKLMGLIVGTGNRTASVTLIPQQEELKTNDIVVTAGTEEKIPPNLTVGLINRVSGEPTEPFKTASIEPLIPYDYLEMVAVLRPQALRPDK